METLKTHVVFHPGLSWQLTEQPTRPESGHSSFRLFVTQPKRNIIHFEQRLSGENRAPRVSTPP